MSSSDPLSRLHLVLRSIALVVTALAITACGFHLRGSGGTSVLPASLSTLRIVGTGLDSDSLNIAVRDAFTQAGAQIVDTGDVPTFTIVGETIESQVGSVRTTTGKASEYVLRYSVSFRLDGPHPVEQQTVRLQRDYSFDPARVLAKEQEERELLNNMRREAAQQMVRRVGRTLGR